MRYNHGVRPSLWRRSKQTPQRCSALLALGVGQAGDVADELRAAEGQLGGVARAAVVAAENLADRDVQCSECLADRARVRTALLVEITLRFAVREIAVCLRLIRSGVPEINH